MKKNNQKKEQKKVTQPEHEAKPVQSELPKITDAARALLRKSYGEKRISTLPAPVSTKTKAASSRSSLLVPKADVWKKSRAVTENWGAEFDKPRKVVPRRVLHTIDNDPVPWEMLQ